MTHRMGGKSQLLLQLSLQATLTLTQALTLTLGRRLLGSRCLHTYNTVARSNGTRHKDKDKDKDRHRHCHHHRGCASSLRLPQQRECVPVAVEQLPVCRLQGRPLSQRAVQLLAVADLTRGNRTGGERERERLRRSGGQGGVTYPTSCSA